MRPEAVIAVMGEQGSGKSSFINLVSGSHLAVSESLELGTLQPQFSEPFELEGRTITLLDTPGFDDVTISDTDTLKMVSVYLAAKYDHTFKLSGIIYLHRITDMRIGGMSRRNFSMLRKLCGADTFNTIVVVTNMWSQVSEERGVANEEELRMEALRPLLDRGAEMHRHDGTLDSARTILRHLMNRRPSVLSDRQMPAERMTVDFHEELASLRERHRAELDTIRNEMTKANRERDLIAKKEVAETRREFEDRVRKLEEDKERLTRLLDQEREQAGEEIRQLKEALVEERRRLQRSQNETERLKGGRLLRILRRIFGS